MTAAPPVHAPARGDDLISDELIRETRTRVDERRLERRARLVYAVGGIAMLAAIVASALLLEHGAPSSLPTVALFLALYALVSRVEFEVGTGSTAPVELVLVPMLFAVPLGLVPAVVAAAFVVPTLLARRWSSVLPLLWSAAPALGPVLVLGLADGFPLRWSAWPVYVAALAAQFAFDFVNAIVAGRLAHGVPVRTTTRFMAWIWLVDAALAPIGLAIAFATLGHTWLVVLVLPLVGLLRHFARERRRRIDHALELSDAYRGTAFLLGDVVEADDAYTGSHSRHVVDLVLAVCDEVGLNPSDRRNAEFVALLHDVGKIRIPAEIINKPGPLDDDEFELMKTHTIEGEAMLEKVGGLLGDVGRIVRSCHERWDGAGYPDRLGGEQIPLIARIVCACDAFSAITTDRPYRKARTQAEAVEEMVRCSGTHFDPRVVDAIVMVASRGRAA
jgi:HD-GYP domain-containing protein (c-di-GMP phosphodiesterase class II)